MIDKLKAYFFAYNHMFNKLETLIEREMDKDKYSITYWGRRGDEGYDWITDHFFGESEEEAVEDLKIKDRSFREPFEIWKIIKF